MELKFARRASSSVGTSSLLIVPYGIEIQMEIVAECIMRAFNRTLWN